MPLAPVGAILPGGFEIGRRKMRGVESNGMLCSGKELGLSDDGAGLLILGDEAPGEPGTPLTEALGLEPDIVFDITVEGNRPDAWSMVGIARDLAARLGLPFSAPEPPAPAAERAAGRGGGDRASVESPDLCPRLTVSVLDDVVVGPSPRVDRPAAPAGRDAPDQQRGRRVELRDARAGPAHPPLRPGAAARARAAASAGPRPGETLETLDGVGAHVGVRGRSLGDTGEDCLICDAEGTPVGIAGIMGGASSEIARRDHRGAARGGLLHARWRSPAPPSASACAPRRRPASSAAATPGASSRRCDASASCWPRACPGSAWPTGMLDVRGDVPEPFVVSVPVGPGAPPDRRGARAGEEIARLLEPIGFTVMDRDGTRRRRRTRRPGDRDGADEPARRAARALRGGRRD